MSMTGATMVIPTVAASYLSGGCAPPELAPPPRWIEDRDVAPHGTDDVSEIDAERMGWSQMWDENVGVGFD